MPSQNFILLPSLDCRYGNQNGKTEGIPSPEVRQSWRATDTGIFYQILNCQQILWLDRLILGNQSHFDGGTT